MGYKVGYIGNYYKIPEYIIQNEEMELVSVVCEEGRLSNELLTFLLVRDIEYKEVKKKEDIVNALCNDNIDFWIMCSFGRKIPQESVVSKEIYNIHYGKLPYYKGRHPTFWATVNNETKLGITLHVVREEFDEGEIVCQEVIPYYLWMNEDDIFDELTKQVPCLLDGLLEYKSGKRKKIENVAGSYYKPVREADIVLELKTDSYTTMYHKVRAQSKYRGAKLVYNDSIYWVKKIEFARINSIKENDFAIRCNDNIYMVIKEYEKENE